MTVSYGFYNSVNGDRKYDAIQMSSIFDGVIGDGVYETIGDAMMVKAVSGNQVTVGTGRAWFNHTWTLNDALLPITMNSSDVINPRYDMIVLEVNETTRTNQIYAIHGTSASSPEKPTLINNDSVHQYPLCYIYRKAGSVEITQSDIENAVGTSACPFVIGVVKVMNIDELVAQWSSQWDDYLEEKGSTFDTWMSEQKLSFETWFNTLDAMLDDNVAANLASQILELQNTLNLIISGKPILDVITDSNGDPIKDYLGNNIQGGLIINKASSFNKEVS